MNKYYIPHSFFEDEDLPRLKITQNLVFKVLSTYYIYHYDEFGLDFEIYSFAENKATAYENVKNSNLALTFLFDLYFDNSIGFQKVICENEPSFTPKIVGKNLKIIYMVGGYIENLTESRKKLLFELLNCYSVAIKFEYQGFFSEALLTYFRIFERIGTDYFQGINKKELHFDFDRSDMYNKIKSIIEKNIGIPFRIVDIDNLANPLINNTVRKIHEEAYAKITYMLKMFQIKYHTSTINEIVTLRNDMTHMKGVNYSEIQLMNCCSHTKNYASDLISQYFFNIAYSKIRLKKGDRS